MQLDSDPEKPTESVEQGAATDAEDSTEESSSVTKVDDSLAVDNANVETSVPSPETSAEEEGTPFEGAIDNFEETPADVVEELSPGTENDDAFVLDRVENKLDSAPEVPAAGTDEDVATTEVKDAKDVADPTNDANTENEETDASNADGNDGEDDAADAVKAATATTKPKKKKKKGKKRK
jgi:hypothetical protein